MSDLSSNGQKNQSQDENQPFQTAFQIVGQFLEEDEWHPQQLEGKTIYRVWFKGKNGDLRCYAQIRDDLQQFLFYAVAPIKAPEESRMAVAEFITRANYGMRIGNFELDFSDGEIRYKSSIDYENATLDKALIKNAVYPTVQTMDRYLQGLMQVIYGSRQPAEAIDEIEGNN